MTEDSGRLRPLERRVLRLAEAGHDNADIARRFKRSPEFIGRVLDLARLPGRRPRAGRPSGLRPLERRILRWREQGATYADIGPRFHRSPEFVERVERLAQHRLGT
jgi:DNA-binding CsgD family transcriptional regulator